VVSILSTVRDIERLRQIVIVLGRHGFGEIVQRAGLARLTRKPEDEDAVEEEGGERPSAPPPAISFGARLRLVLQDLGPSFVKLGQILSTRPDLIPEDIIVELEKLQDDVQQIPFEELRGPLEHELDRTIAEVFEVFDERPLASASMAQVHRGRLRVPDGESIDVAVKIQRPGIQSVIERDIELLYLLARTIERTIPESRIYAPIGLVTEFERAMTAELDFGREADHAHRFAENFADDPTARFPKVYATASSRRVLTLEFLAGLKPQAAVDAGYSGEQIARTALRVLFKQIFEHGLFHADPHPGNIMIMGAKDAPVFGLIDLGLVGRLSPALRDKTVDLMVAAVRQDSKGVADALYAIGTPTKKVNRDRYDAEVTMLAEKYLGKPLREIEMSALISDIVTGATKYGLEIPPDFLMLGRTLMTIEGVGKDIHPDLDVFSEMRPYFLGLVRKRYSPDRLGADALRALSRLSGTATGLPEKLDDVLEDLRRGDLVVRTADPEIPRATDLLGRRIFSGLTVAALISGGAHLLASGATPIVAYAMLGLAGTWGCLHGFSAWRAQRAMRRRLDE
jgi:ubiquinone biosynthesis protein